ncbi:MAG: hypothetical protein EBY29_14985 [Planctomycetes bacterium]|nr:hypothetical protein [Planctomycetota bacterium]
MMPRKSTTTIEIPTKLLKSLLRSDALELAIANAEGTAGVTDGKESRDWQRMADQLQKLEHLLYAASTRSKRRKATKVDVSCLLSEVFGNRSVDILAVFGYASLMPSLNTPHTSGDLVVDAGWKPSEAAYWYRLAAIRGIGFCSESGVAL